MGTRSSDPGLTLKQTHLLQLCRGETVKEVVLDVLAMLGLGRVDVVAGVDGLDDL
jgi:hypothetical protein